MLHTVVTEKRASKPFQKVKPPVAAVVMREKLCHIPERGLSAAEGRQHTR